jgi:hypothetical protein
VILWKQYSGRKAQEVDRNSPGKNPDNFQLEYCFHVAAISGVFLQNPVARIIDLGINTCRFP